MTGCRDGVELWVAGEGGGASGAHWLWVCLGTTMGEERGMSGGRKVERDEGLRRGDGKKSCQSEGQGILPMNKGVCVVHIMPQIDVEVGGDRGETAGK